MLNTMTAHLGIDSWTPPELLSAAVTYGYGSVSTIGRGIVDDRVMVAEISTLEPCRIHDFLEVIYLPCKISAAGLHNLAWGNVSEVSITSATAGTKTCAILPYLDKPGPHKSLNGLCVCVSCLKKLPFGNKREQEETLKKLYERAVSAVVLTTRHGVS